MSPLLDDGSAMTKSWAVERERRPFLPVKCRLVWASVKSGRTPIVAGRGSGVEAAWRRRRSPGEDFVRFSRASQKMTCFWKDENFPNGIIGVT